MLFLKYSTTSVSPFSPLSRWIQISLSTEQQHRMDPAGATLTSISPSWLRSRWDSGSDNKQSAAGNIIKRRSWFAKDASQDTVRGSSSAAIGFFSHPIFGGCKLFVVVFLPPVTRNIPSLDQLDGGWGLCEGLLQHQSLFVFVSWLANLKICTSANLCTITQGACRDFLKGRFKERFHMRTKIQTNPKTPWGRHQIRN